MKIGISVYGNSQAMDGTMVRALRTYRLLSEKHEVILIAKTNKAVGGKTGGKDTWLLRAPLRAIQMAWWSLKLVVIAIVQRFDVIYCSNDYYGFPALFACSKILKYKLIYEAHSIMSADLLECGWPSVIVKLFEKLETFILKKADFIVALTPNVFEYCKGLNNKVELIPLFLDGREPLHKISKDPFVKTIGLIGPFNEPRKRENLKFLYSNLDKFNHRIRILIIGHCDDRVKTDIVNYTGYLETTDDYLYQISRLDAVIVPEKMETTGTPTRIIDPMSCAVPVFTTPKGVVGLHWIEKSKDIFVFELDTLIDQINKLVFDDELMAQVGINGRQLVEQYYSRNINQKKLTAILEALAK
ncbi:MAG: glycosyltransferase [Dehalococcoidia bacterium]|jgi:glycosyltransferase involved in cell wall biosynthesis